MHQMILIIGASNLNHEEMIHPAKNYGIDKKCLEIVTDYKRIVHYDFEKLKNNHKYREVIYGPCLHKCKGYSSPIARMDTERCYFPMIIKSIANGVLKITKHSFSMALEYLVNNSNYDILI